jgi:FAD dependent oxidoreductase TIGR03364
MVDLVIIGSGVMGTFHAYHAALAGKKVVVLEKDLQPMESSVRNFGQVVPSGFAPGRWHQYGRYSTALYQSLQAKYDIGIRNLGSVYLANTEDEAQLLEELKQQFDAAAYPSIPLSQAQVLEKWPAVKSSYVRSALYFPQEVSSESRKMIHALHRSLQETMKIEFHYLSAVHEINDLGEKVRIKTSRGKTFEAATCIVCNGRDFKYLYPELFEQANIEMVKLNMMVTKPLPEISLPGNILTGLTIRRYESFKALPSYGKLDPSPVNPLTVTHGIHILFKQRTDGSIVIGDSHHYADIAQSDQLGFDYDVEVGKIILEEAKQILALPSWDLAQQWNGFYAQMKGDEEIFEAQPSTNIYIATAIGGKGMTASAGYTKERIEKLYQVVLDDAHLQPQ